MIRVTVELIPGGCESLKRHLGTAEIANTGTGSKTRGDYRARFSRRGQPGSTWRTASIEGFPRKQLGHWHLLLLLLAIALGPSRKGE